MSQLRASPTRTIDSTATAFSTGREPGSPRQVGQTWLLGGAPNVVSQPQNIFDTVPSSTCTSRPRTGSKDATAWSKSISSSAVPMLIRGPRGIASAASDFVGNNSRLVLPAPEPADDDDRAGDEHEGVEQGVDQLELVAVLARLAEPGQRVPPGHHGGDEGDDRVGLLR